MVILPAVPSPGRKLAGFSLSWWRLAVRLVVFIDAQNLYRGARTAFLAPDRVRTERYVFGQINPWLLGQTVSERRVPDSQERVLQEVRVYTGRPDATRDPRTYAAHMKQCSAWSKTGVTVIPRTLRYPPDYPNAKAEEKGIDVALAIDFVAYAIDGLCDVGVIVSSDTDLRPALEYVSRKCSHQCTPEVAAWRSSSAKSRLSIKGANVWCHWLYETDYNTVHDPTDYNL
jgi:uncharacterized LabA/DUF88 family protein